MCDHHPRWGTADAEITSPPPTSPGWEPRHWSVCVCVCVCVMVAVTLLSVCEYTFPTCRLVLYFYFSCNGMCALVRRNSTYENTLVLLLLLIIIIIIIVIIIVMISSSSIFGSFNLVCLKPVQTNPAKCLPL